MPFLLLSFTWNRIIRFYQRKFLGFIIYELPSNVEKQRTKKKKISDLLYLLNCNIAFIF